MTDPRIAHLEPELEQVVASNGALGAAPMTALMRTDFGNAERLVAAHGSDLRYVRGVGWLTWSRGRFRRDEDGAVMRCPRAASATRHHAVCAAPQRALSHVSGRG